MAEAVIPVAASAAMGGMHMGKENDLMLDYLRDNQRFADLFNGGLFAGKQVVNADDLMEAHTNLVCVNELKDFSTFSTGLRELFSLMPYRKDKQAMEQFLENHEEYKHLDEETARVIGGMIGVDTFMDDKKRYEEGGKYNMCQAIREMMMDSWNEGNEQGIEQGVERGVSLSASIFRAIRSGISDNQAIADSCSCTVSEVENIRKAFDI